MLSRFGSPVRRNVSAEDPLWLGPSGWCQVTVWLPVQPSAVVLSLKRSPLEWWLQTGQVPADVGLVYAPHAADPRVLPLLGGALPPRVPVVFVGDLDPLAIVHYLQLRRVAPFRRRLRYGGLDSSWLDAVGKMLRRPLTPDRLRIRLSTEEIHVLALLEGVVPLQKLIGAPAVALLRSGFKVELEGATNPELFRRKRYTWAFRLVRRAAAVDRGV